jgi:hypothetical protein
MSKSYTQKNIERMLGENLKMGSFANAANNSKNYTSIFAKAKKEMGNKTRKIINLKEPIRSSGQSTLNVLREGSSFERATGINPKNYIKSRRRRHGRPSSTPYYNNTPKNVRYFPVPNKPKNITKKQKKVEGQKPRPGKFMRECRDNSKSEGCVRHKGTHNCKFVHRDEPEWQMLREDQKVHGGGVPPLSKVNTYTSWPGGIDPTATLYNQAKML